MTWFEDNARTFHEREFKAKESIYTPLASAQFPKALVITCADSRIGTRKLLGAGPGDILELRNAGNSIPPNSQGSEVGTIELAVGVLNVKDIILIGHTFCWIGLTMQNPPEILENLPAVSNWAKEWHKARKVVDALNPPLTGDDWVNRLIEENVAQQLRNVGAIPRVREAVAAGEVNLHGWVYHLESGQVSKLDQSTGTFSPL